MPITRLGRLSVCSRFLTMIACDGLEIDEFPLGMVILHLDKVVLFDLAARADAEEPAFAQDLARQ